MHNGYPHASTFPLIESWKAEEQGPGSLTLGIGVSAMVLLIRRTEETGIIERRKIKGVVVARLWRRCTLYGILHAE